MMKTASRTRPAIGLALVATTAMLVSACSIGKKTAPDVTGPSEFGLSVTMAASPDQLPRDGTSRSTVTLTARDASGNGAAGQRFTISTSGVTGAAVSATQVTTGSDGRATFSVVAPPATAIGNAIDIAATPIGTDFQNAVPRTISIGISGPSNATAPTPAFSVTPTAPEIQQVATFDASTTTDEGRSCGAACTYAWDFDDGATATGMQVTHTYTVARSYNVALTVTDASGLAVTKRQVVVVAAASAPTVTMTVVPSPPLLNQTATFTAAATPAQNHSIRSYAWNFGDGATATTTVPTTTHVFTGPGTFVATVTVTDDIGQTGVGTTSFSVSSGISVSFTFSPTGPNAGTAVNFNASGTTSSAGANIVTYAWDFGDGNSGTGVTTSHAFAAAGTYVVRLTVTDSLGRTATLTQQVTVS